MSRKSRRKRKQEDRPAKSPPTPPAPAPVPSDDPLTERERLFVEEYIADPNATQAYLRAFKTASYAVAATKGHLLLKKVEIQAEIQAARRMQAKRIRLAADRTVREVARLAFADAADLFDADNRMLPVRKVPIHTRRAIQAVKVKRQKIYGDQKGDGPVGEEEVIEVKLASKDAALGRLMKHQGLDRELPALEVLLGFLPESVRDEVRRAVGGQVRPDGDADGTGPNAGDSA